MAGIAHTGPGGVAVSVFGYGYDVGGSITRWTQSQPFHTVEPMSAWTIEQDAADQLTGVSVEGRAAGRQVFSYDLAGNRLTAQSGNATSTTAYNALNQITGISGGGRLRFSGTTSEAANVSVQGRAARMLDDKTFTADAEVVPGVNTIPVVATDGNGNRRTNNYQVTVPSGATRAFVYDGNGNLLDDGERTYQWDAKNRLIEAKRGADTWQWSYNAFDQRVSEKKNGVVTKRWVWAGVNQPAEERDAAGNVTRRFYPQGEQAGATKFYYTKDHLGSIREVLGANGTVVSSSRYDAWGVRTTQGAQDAASFGFTGHLEHKELGLVFTLYRAYDPVTGRWLSRDPIGEEGGINLYGYVSNRPVNLWDPLGLSPSDWWDIPAKIERAQEIANEELAKHHGHNDCDDANRHAEWSKRMADELGGWFSDLVGTGHELEGLLNGAPFDETVMDLNNNKEGRNSSREQRDINQNNLRTTPNQTTGIGGPYGY